MTLFRRSFFTSLVSSLAFAQEATPAKQHYLIRLIPKRANFLESMTEEEGRIMGRHFEYLKQLHARNKIVIAGPVPDPKDTFGIAIVETASLEEARDIARNDPSVQAGINRSEVQPFRIALIR